MRTQSKMLMLGWPGVDWALLGPLMDAGKLPQLQRLVDAGVMGDLSTVEPSSPESLFASLMTGKRPHQHGVFAETSARKTSALWTMLSERQLESWVVGGADIVEPILGGMVSRRFAAATAPIEQPWPLAPDSVFPLAQAEEFAALRVHPHQLTQQQVLPFLPDLGKMDLENDPQLGRVLGAVAECATVQAAATALLSEPWNFFAVHYDALSALLSPFGSHFYDGVAEAACRFLDMMLGVLLSQISSDVVVMMVSEKGPSGKGALVVAGPGFKRDERIYGASILDVAPTILSGFGLPIADDFDGHVLRNAFVEPPCSETIPSWGCEPVTSAPDDSALYGEACSLMQARQFAAAAERLETLHETFSEESQYGLMWVQCLNALKKHSKARAVLEVCFQRKAKAAATAENALRLLGDAVENRAEQPPEKRREIERLIAQNSVNDVSFELLNGIQYLAEGDPEAALVYFNNAEMLDPANSHILLHQAACFQTLENDSAAEACYLRLQEREAEPLAVSMGLCRIALKRGQHEKAAGAALDAVAVDFATPEAHYLLGVALQNMGRIPEAIEAMQVCVAQNPSFVSAYEGLSTMYRESIGNIEQAERYERLARSFGRDGAVPSSARTDSLVVVSGLSGSGLTQMMRTLGESGIPLLSDDEDLSYSPVRSRDKDLSWLVRGKGHAVKIPAALIPTFSRGPALPIRVIFMERDVSELIAAHRIRGEGAHLTDQEFATLLEKQSQAAKHLFEVAAFPMLFVSHSEFTQHPERVAETVNQFLSE